MGIEQNKEIVRRFMQLFSEARLDEAFELLDDNMTWTLWGSGPAAGAYTKAAMKDLLLQSWQWFNGLVLWTPTEMTAEEDRVAVMAVSNATTHGGYHHTNKYHNLFRVRNGKIVEVLEIFPEGPVAVLFEHLQAEQAAPVRPTIKDQR
ncbi:MAG: nuclear transport factor 2 family protein [Steroidobacteraceae bacterium]